MTRRAGIWNRRNRTRRCDLCGRWVWDRYAHPTIDDGTITAWTCRTCHQTSRHSPTNRPASARQTPSATHVAQTTPSPSQPQPGDAPR